MRSGALRIALIYISISLCWITLSDRILFLLHDSLNEHAYILINSGKGFVFVLANAFFLFRLILREQKKLSENETQYRMMYEHNPNPMWIYDPSTFKFVSVNDAAVVHYGYSCNEFLNMTILDIRPKEDSEKVTTLVNSLGMDHNESGTWRHCKKDGSIIFVSISSHKTLLKNKEQIMVLARDTTEKVLFEQQLEKVNLDLAAEKKKLSETQQITKVSGWEFYPEEQRLIWSDEFYAATNTLPDPSKKPFDIYLEHIYPEDRAQMTQALDLLIRTGKKLDVTHRIRMSGGETRYIRQLARVESKAGEPLKIAGSMQDITELKLVEHERNSIYEEKRKLADIITKVNNMVLLTDAENNITWVNKAFEDQTGYKLNDIWGELPSDFLCGPDSDYEVIKTLRQKKAARETFSLDLTYYTRNGQKHWVNGEFTPLFDDNGLHTGYITVYNNITLRKKNEDEVRRQNAILKEVAWISSHEIRKPVANIMGLVALIKATSNQDEKAHLISLVDKCAEDLDGIVHSIDAKVYSEKNTTI